MPKLKKPTLNNSKNIPFEEKLEKLKEIVEDLEDGETPLRESMDSYQKSLNLIKECYAELEDAELKIEKIMKKEGKIISESLE